jgi:transaldolase
MYLSDIGFSLWADYIERSFIDGRLRELVKSGVVNGATSNPAIFKEAILGSPVYKKQLQSLAELDPKAKYEALATEDIRRACDLFLTLYEKGDDGFVSIEVDPRLCDDAAGTVAEARRLLERIDRPNVMIKVPATEAGYQAMEELASSGVHVNATLVFSPHQARKCLDAFEKAQDGAKSVISVFVSRFDRKLDPLLPEPLRGKSGIYNAAKIYADIEARVLPHTRALFASTGVKGGDYPPHYYIEQLLARRSVNTAPIHTIEAFVEHGEKTPRLPIPPQQITDHFLRLRELGIDMDRVYGELLEEGMEAFVKAFEEILKELS